MTAFTTQSFSISRGENRPLLSVYLFFNAWITLEVMFHDLSLIVFGHCHSSSNMGKRNNSYTISEKVAVAKFAITGSITGASKKYAIDRKRIREWKKLFETGKLENLSPGLHCLPGGGRKVRNEDIDNSVLEWFTTMRDKCFRVTGKNILFLYLLLLVHSKTL